MRSFVFVICLLLIVASPAYSQRLNWIQGDCIVQLEDRKAVDVLHQRLEASSPFANMIAIAPRQSIYLLQFDYTQHTFSACQRFLHKQQGVAAVQRNFLLENRSLLPDDPLFNEQWGWLNIGQEGGIAGSDIGATEVWPYTTGQITPKGDTIVIALIDNGIQQTHPDLEDQLWLNREEIPNNLIDDDLNDFVDDYLGWNVSAENDLLSQGSHGTKVAGVMSSTGNNGIGVAGLAYGARLMVLECELGSSSELLQAYDYVRQQRALYNNTNGEKGAYVVATNTSWGVTGISESEAPIWCGFFETLGTEGILNIVAVPNAPLDLDEVFDLPTACASPFVISTTAINRFDERSFAAFGGASVDIAAPGEDIWTTSATGGYTMASGTSFAAPAVTGAIALLYGVPCSPTSITPMETALQIKDILLGSITELPSLEGEVSTGGRLNIWNAVQNQLSFCNDCPQITSWTVQSIGDANSLVTWALPPGIDEVIVEWKPENETVWLTSDGGTNAVLLNGLTSCSSYNLRFTSFCSSGDTIVSSEYRFKTRGCCDEPMLTYSWEQDQLCFQFSPLTTGEVELFDGTQLLNVGLMENGDICFGPIENCENLSIRLKINCSSESYNFSYDLDNICSGCTRQAYCRAGSLAMGTEWIAGVAVGEWEHQSGPDDGFGDFIHTGPSLHIGESCVITLTPGFLDYSYEEYFRVWIDFNQNGWFEDDEMIVDPGYSTYSALSTNISVPEDAVPGQTRMRVLMQYLGFNDIPASSCATDFHFGEVEDYCITILEEEVVTSIVSNENSNMAWRIMENPVNTELTIFLEGSTSRQVTWQLLSANGQPIQSWNGEDLSIVQEKMVLPLKSLPSGVYFLVGRMEGVVQSEKVVILTGY